MRTRPAANVPKPLSDARRQLDPWRRRQGGRRRLPQDVGKKGTSDDEVAEGRPKAKGHARNGAEAYVGVEKIRIPHASLKPGDACPSCHKATVYESVAPGHLVRIRGQARLGTTIMRVFSFKTSRYDGVASGVRRDGLDNESERNQRAIVENENLLLL